MDYKFNFYHLFKFNIQLHKILKLTSHFKDFNEFIVDSTNHSIFDNRLINARLLVNFPESKVLFYHTNILIDSCEHLKGLNLVSFLNQIYFEHLSFERIYSIKKICPLVFMNSKINLFSLAVLTNTFYLTRKFVFHQIDYKLNINCSVSALNIQNTVRVNINDEFLNWHIFKDLTIIYISGSVSNIQDDVFKNFTKLKNFVFDGQNFRQQAHKTKMKWLNFLHSEININSNNMSEIDLNSNEIINLMTSLTLTIVVLSHLLT